MISSRYFLLVFFLAATISAACALQKKDPVKAGLEKPEVKADEALETFVDIRKPSLVPTGSGPGKEWMAPPQKTATIRTLVAPVRIESLKEKIEEINGKIERLNTFHLEEEQAFNTLKVQQQQAAQQDNQLEEQLLLLSRRIEELDEKYSRRINYQLSQDALKESMIYEKAQRLYRSGNFVDAVIMFKKHVSSFPQSTLADNAQYWIGEGYYSQGDYNRALEEFEKVNLFPDKSKVPDALLRKGYCYLQLKNYTQAREIFSQVINTYPDNQAEYAVVDSARRKLSEIKGKK
jgi:tol-pal system protein YbgF